MAINLDVTSQVLTSARAVIGAGQQEIQHDTGAVHQLFGNFLETLDRCEKLLADERYFAKRDGFVLKISYYNHIELNVENLRHRLAFHNIQVS